jgi:diacylglycerol kinase family enzyme
VCLNTDPYTFLGSRPFTLAPEATLDAPLSIVTLRTLDALPLISLVASALGSGRRLRSSRFVDHRSGVSSAVIEAYGPVPYQVDGDHLGEVEQLRVRHEPAVMDLVVPRAPTGVDLGHPRPVTPPRHA